MIYGKAMLQIHIGNALDTVIDYTADLLNEHNAITTNEWDEVVRCIWRIADITGAATQLEQIRGRGFD